MKSKKKYCLNMSSYKYKIGFKHLLPPIILKESNNLNISIVNIIPTQNKCPSGKNCPNYKIIFELKQEIIKLIDKIAQLKKITEFSISNPEKKNYKSQTHKTQEKEEEKKNYSICNQLINSFRNSSKNKLFHIKINPYNTNLFKNNILRPNLIKLRPNSAKNADIKESLEKMLNEEKNKNNEKLEPNKSDADFLNNINKRININLFSSSTRKINENNTIYKKLNNNRYENDNCENNSNSRNIKFFIHDSLSSLRKSKTNELSSLNLHLSNSIISPAIKITPKNLFDSYLKKNRENKDNKENIENKKIIEIKNYNGNDYNCNRKN